MMEINLKEILRAPAEMALRAYLRALPRQEFSPEKVNRVLVFAYHGLGNFIMYTPALKLLRERYPRARIDLQVGNRTGCEEVARGSDLFDNIYNLPHSADLSSWADRLIEIRRTRYDVTINEFHSHSWKLALLVALSGAPYRVGHVTSPGWPRRFSRYSFVFNIPVSMREDEHEIERYIDLVAAIGARRIKLDEAKPFIHITESDRRFAREFLGPCGANLIIGVQPGTSPTMRWKQWPIERFRELIERILVEIPGARIVLFGSPTEAEMAAELGRGLEPKVMVAAGKTTVKQVAALIERCDMLVCNDSGLMHVAVAVGTPVVAIYGPTDINRTAPLGRQHIVIRHPLPCSPCFKLEGDRQVNLCPHHDCLMTITAEEVLAAVRRAAESKLARR